MVVFHIDPFLVSVHELKAAAVLAVERFLAAHSAAKRGTVAPAPAAPASVAPQNLALAHQVGDSDQTAHGGVGVAGNDGHDSSVLLAGSVLTPQHSTAVNGAGRPGDSADTARWPVGWSLRVDPPPTIWSSTDDEDDMRKFRTQGEQKGQHWVHSCREDNDKNQVILGKGEENAIIVRERTLRSR